MLYVHIYYVEILLICNFHPSRARNFATTIISKLNNFAEVLAVHVDVYMATPVLRSLTHETLCDTGQRTRRNLPTTTYPSPNPSTLNHLYLFFLRLRRKKIIDGKKIQKDMNMDFSKKIQRQGSRLEVKIIKSRHQL